jgi:hypothetical protein
MSEAPQATVESQVRAVREWISSTTLKSNFLSTIKSLRDTRLLLQIDAYTNDPADEALQKIEALVQGGDA